MPTLCSRSAVSSSAGRDHLLPSQAHSAEDGSPAQEYGGGRNFGHLAYRTENIYETCQRLMDAGVTINRPPRDGHMAFVKTPDGISIELLQKGSPLAAAEPWALMLNVGKW